MIDITKPEKYNTRSGRAVRFYADDGVAPFTIHGAFHLDSGWMAVTWAPDGRYTETGKHTTLDLVEVSP